MPLIAEKHDLDAENFKGAVNPVVLRYDRSNAYYYRQFIPDTKEYRSRVIKDASNMQEAIEKAHLAFLEIRQLPKKKQKRKGHYDSGYVDFKSWSDYCLPVGGVYIYTTDFDTIKIGKTNDFINRFRKHQTSNPEQIKVLMLIEEENEDVRDRLEKELHCKCDKYRRVSEWFWYVPTIQNMIKDLQDEQGFTPFIFGRKPPNFD
tara:strand:- start:1502 stop:2113 length:612 start_codon:yes stop_codon:yes gene_type:complete